MVENSVFEPKSLMAGETPLNGKCLLICFQFFLSLPLAIHSNLIFSKNRVTSVQEHQASKSWPNFGVVWFGRGRELSLEEPGIVFKLLASQRRLHIY